MVHNFCFFHLLSVLKFLPLSFHQRITEQASKWQFRRSFSWRQGGSRLREGSQLALIIISTVVSYLFTALLRFIALGLIFLRKNRWLDAPGAQLTSFVSYLPIFLMQYGGGKLRNLESISRGWVFLCVPEEVLLDWLRVGVSFILVFFIGQSYIYVICVTIFRYLQEEPQILIGHPCRLLALY